MKPYLLIEGVPHEIKSIDYPDGKPTAVTVNQHGGTMIHWDASINLNDDAIVLEDAIFWEGRYAPIYEGIEILVSDYTDELEELSKQIAEAYTETGWVTSDLSKRYGELKQLIYGAHQAKKIIDEALNIMF